MDVEQSTKWYNSLHDGRGTDYQRRSFVPLFSVLRREVALVVCQHFVRLFRLISLFSGGLLVQAVQPFPVLINSEIYRH